MKRLFALASIAILVLSGCSLIRATGGGWMYGVDGDEDEATFGLGINCGGDYLKGAGVYHDKDATIGKEAVNVNAHFKLGKSGGGWTEKSGQIKEDVPISCHIKCDTLNLMYRAAPCRGPDCVGRAEVKLTDTGDQGPNKGDELRIEFLSGPYEDYLNDRVIQGGNLKLVFED